MTPSPQDLRRIQQLQPAADLAREILGLCTGKYTAEHNLAIVIGRCQEALQQADAANLAQAKGATNWEALRGPGPINWESGECGC